MSCVNPSGAKDLVKDDIQMLLNCAIRFSQSLSDLSPALERLIETLEGITRRQNNANGVCASVAAAQALRDPLKEAVLFRAILSTTKDSHRMHEENGSNAICEDNVLAALSATNDIYCSFMGIYLKASRVSDKVEKVFSKAGHSIIVELQGFDVNEAFMSWKGAIQEWRSKTLQPGWVVEQARQKDSPSAG